MFVPIKVIFMNGQHLFKETEIISKVLEAKFKRVESKYFFNV